MSLHSLRRSRQPLAIALALAVLLLVGWGQVHRVLHPAATAVSALATLPAPGHGHTQDTDTHLGHAAHGSLCLLFDHLADGTAAMQAPCLPVLSRPRAGLPQSVQNSLAGVRLRPFDARGPPPLA